MLEMPACESPTGAPKMMQAMATTMKTMMVATLMTANQNSASPYIFTLIMFNTKTSARATSAMTHWGTGMKTAQ